MSIFVKCLGETQKPRNPWMTPRKGWILLGCLALSMVVNVLLTLAFIFKGQLLQGNFCHLKWFGKNVLCDYFVHLLMDKSFSRFVFIL
jgi:hypothetical protein